MKLVIIFTQNVVKSVFLFWICSSTSSAFGWGNQDYAHHTLNRMAKIIDKKYINGISTSEVATRAGTPENLIKCFENEIVTDPIDESVSEENKNKKCMKQIRAILHKKEPSGEKLEFTEFNENILLAFDAKEKALIAERDGLFLKKILLGTGVLSGGATVFMGGFHMKGRKKDKQLVIVGGALTVIGTGIFLCRTLGKDAQLTIHIEQVQAMKSAWKEKM